MIKDPEKQDEYILKLKGLSELPDILRVDFNYEISAKGSITKEEIKSNFDGSYKHIYHFESINVDITDELGQKIKAKDSRSESKLWRAIVWNEWKNSNTDISEEEFYSGVWKYIRDNKDKIIEGYLRNL